MKRLVAFAAALLATASLEAAAIGRMADLAIVDRTTGRELPVYWHEGRAYVVGKPGNEYQVVVRSRRSEDLLAVVSVDGVNVVSGETASPDQGGYVLSPWRRLEIQGWRKNLSETAAFYFTSLGDSYAGRTGRPDNVGVIGVALFQRARRVTLPVEIDPPYSYQRKEGANEAAPGADAQMKRHGAPPAAAQSAPLGTGHGRRESSYASYTEFERATRDPVEVIAIHYDSYANLVAMGVIPRNYGRRPSPDPFPQAFVPDPPRYRW